ncbi:hypothetical protein [Mangrovicoccus ximenensis]|uniref:hypothetical protein n=1 Tax=Mangrovicoccus ximenensis TaxID=1911570 RepID=UPI0038B3A408
MRFTGARILRDGALQERSIAIAEGRITKGPLPAVDMSGYLILPGVIDMMAARPARRGGWTDAAEMLGAAGACPGNARAAGAGLAVPAPRRRAGAGRQWT